MQVCIIGCGTMGLIYARAFGQQQIIKEGGLLLVEKNENRRKELQLKNINTIAFPDERMIANTAVMLLAVKPQDFEEVAAALKGRLPKDCVVISIMAGIQLGSLCSKLGTEGVVRAMPNAPALYEQGMTVYCCSETISSSQQRMAGNLLSVTGKVVETKEEGLLNAVTAVSGSGPAYFFYLAQQMISEAIVLGIDPETAELLVKQTLLGAGVMLDQSGKTCEELVQSVASKGGTTEAALHVFDGSHFGATISEALQKAAQRSAELAK